MLVFVCWMCVIVVVILGFKILYFLCPSLLLVVCFSFLTANKPTILVVMYHTFNSNHVVLDSSRLMEDPRVHLAVSLLFYEQNLLNSNCNDTAKYEIRKFLGFPEVTTGFTDMLLLLFKDHDAV